MLTLVGEGYWFQAGILARSVLEANLNIYYMLPNTAQDEWPNSKQRCALEEFFKETWSDPARPFDDSSQRNQILLKELAASLGRFQQKDAEVSKHDAGQVALQVLRLLSDYTHMAYPRIMELYDGEQGFVLLGQQEKESVFSADDVAAVLRETCNAAECVVTELERLFQGVYSLDLAKRGEELAKGFDAKRREVAEISQLLSRLGSDIEMISRTTPQDSKKLLRKFKGKV
jgi:hypothetical protein